MATVLTLAYQRHTVDATLSCAERGTLAHGGARVGSWLEAGSVHIDAEALLAALLDAGRHASAVASAPPDVIALASQPALTVAWRPATGRLAGPAVSGAAAGLALHSRALEPGVAVTGLDSWLLYRLAGVFVTDVATASQAALLDPAGGDWSPDALRRVGRGDSTPPRLVDCATPVGISTLFGRPALVGGIGPYQSMALLGAGARQAGAVRCRYGATVDVTVVTDSGTAGATGGGLVAWRAGAEQAHILRTRVPMTRGTLPGGAEPHPLAAHVAARIGALAAHAAPEPPTRLHADGPRAGSPDLMRAQADLLRAPVLTFATARAVDAGLTALARLAVNDADRLADAAPARPDRVYQPSCAR
jgi:glycerol kinase